jgi:hypothetical protein
MWVVGCEERNVSKYEELDVRDRREQVNPNQYE